MTRSGIEPTTSRSRCERSNHWASAAFRTCCGRPVSRGGSPRHCPWPRSSRPATRWCAGCTAPATSRSHPTHTLCYNNCLIVCVLLNVYIIMFTMLYFCFMFVDHWWVFVKYAFHIKSSYYYYYYFYYYYYYYYYFYSLTWLYQLGKNITLNSVQWAFKASDLKY